MCIFPPLKQFLQNITEKSHFRSFPGYCTNMDAFSGPGHAFSGPRSLFFVVWVLFAFPFISLTKFLHKKEISGSVLPDPENRVQVGPDLHLVGTPNIFIIFSPEKASVTSVI